MIFESWLATLASLSLAVGAATGAVSAVGTAASASDETPGGSDTGVWGWEDGAGGLHYSRWYEIPEAARRQARRVSATVDAVARDRPPSRPSTGAPPLEPQVLVPQPGAPPLPPIRCGQLDRLRQQEKMAGAAEARPGIDEQLEDVDYVVAGITPAEIRRDLDSKHAGGFDASLGWRVTWTFRRDLDGSSSCRLAAPRVTLRMKRTMPRLGSTTGRDGVVDAQWAAYLVALGRHEAGHQANGAAAANDVLEALAGFAGQPCLSADRAAGECARSIIAEHRRLDGEYDARTRHGAADGARFP